MKRPSFQFYVGDWQSNSNLRRCTFAEKGIWLDVMCLLHDGEQYGVLHWPLKEIAQAVGCKLAELKSLAAKGVLKGADTGEQCEAHIYTPRSGGKDGDPVMLIPVQPGPIWYSSRMVTDEHVRCIRGKGTRFGEEKPATKPPGESQPSRRVGGNQSSEEGDGIKEEVAENCGSSQTTPENRITKVSDCNLEIHDQPSRWVDDGPSTSSSSTSSSEGKEPSSDKYPLPPWVPVSEWDSFVEMRKKIPRCPFTKKAKTLAINRLDELRKQGYNPVEIINAAVLNSWKTFYPPRDDYGNRNPKPNQNSVAKRTSALYRAGTGLGEGEPMEPGAGRGEAGYKPEREGGDADGA